MCYRRDYGSAALLFESFVFGEEQTGPKHEVTGIPQIAFVEVTFGRFVVGFFDEAIDGKDIGPNRWAGTNVAIFGRGPCRLHTKGDNTIGASRIGGESTTFNEGCRIGDHVIGGERDNDWIVGAPGCIGRARRNGRTGIAACRLE